MTPYWTDGQVALHHGDCLDVLASLPGSSVDAVVTDPPYGLEFMGREWDGADGFRRSLNPEDAGRDSVFGRISRTSPEYQTGSEPWRDDQHVGKTWQTGMAPVEMADGFRRLPRPTFERRANVRCRKCEHWRVSSNPCTCAQPDFPNLTLANMATYQAWCEAWAAECLRLLKPGGYLLAFGGTRTYHRLTCAIEDAGFEIRDSLHWLYGSGFPKGRACLKPSHEPIVLARKPAAKSAPLNIDACRVDGAAGESWNAGPGGGGFTSATYERGLGRVQPTAGRWPPNILLTHSAACNGDCVPDCPVAELDRQSGIGRTAPPGQHIGKGSWFGSPGRMNRDEIPYYADTGGASRFYPTFRYEAKAPASERPRLPDGTAWPTVKPVALMRWLVRLITPPGGTVLDPFAGTGTTAEACIIEGLNCLLIERDPQAAALIERRLAKPIQPVLGDSA